MELQARMGGPVGKPRATAAAAAMISTHPINIFTKTATETWMEVKNSSTAAIARASEQLKLSEHFGCHGFWRSKANNFSSFTGV